MPAEQPGHLALGHIDTALQGRPRKNDDALSQATMCLAEFRDRLLAARRANGMTATQEKQLRHVNAVITVVLGVHFPLDDVPWDELVKARGWLADIVRDDEPAP